MTIVSNKGHTILLPIIHEISNLRNVDGDGVLLSDTGFNRSTYQMSNKKIKKLLLL